MTTLKPSQLLEALDAAVAEQGSDLTPRLIGDDGAYSLAALSQTSQSLATVLAAKGVMPGDRVGHLGKNSAALIVLLFACARLGALLMPLNWRLSVKEWTWMLDDAAPSVLVTMEGFHQNQDALTGAPCFDLLALLDEAATASIDPLLDTGAGDPDLLLVYTSGSTGRPKGAVHTQGAVWANARLSHAMHNYNPQGVQDRVLTILPMFHVGGLAIQTLSALLHGAQVRVMTAFEPNQMAALHESFRPTLTLHVPATLQAMLNLPQWANLDLSDLRAVSIGSTDVPIELISALQTRSIPVLQIYGATESGPISIFQNIDLALSRPGSIGTVPEGVEIRLQRPDGSTCDLDEAGEIAIRADNLARCYWPNLPLVNADGYWSSGDVASRDAEGVYWFRDRLKNVIISGGENIYPAEIERVLRSVPGVGDCCVVGVASPRWGQTPVAVIEGSPLPLDSIQARLNEELARFKHPSRIDFLPVLPRNAMGKIVRDDVVRVVAEGY